MGRVFNLNVCTSGRASGQGQCGLESDSHALNRAAIYLPITSSLLLVRHGSAIFTVRSQTTCVCVFKCMCKRWQFCIQSAFDLQGETIWRSFERHEQIWCGRPRRPRLPSSRRRLVLIRTDILSCLTVHSTATLASKFMALLEIAFCAQGGGRTQRGFPVGDGAATSHPMRKSLQL